MKLFQILLAIVPLVLTACGGGDVGQIEGESSGLENRSQKLNANLHNDATTEAINDISVTSITLVSKTRISQSDADYVLKVTFLSRQPYTRIRASATYWSSPAVLIDSSIFIGDLAANVAASPEDTITLRAPYQLFSISSLRWTYTQDHQNQVASVVISAQKSLLTGVGERTQITARVYGSDGRILEDRPLLFTSTASQTVSVTPAGEILSRAALGSAEIYATADGVQSNRLTIAVVKVKLGAILLEDWQIIGEPSLKPYKVGNRFEIALQAIPDIHVGVILISAGSKSVSGKVNRVNRITGGVTSVTIEIIPLHEFLDEVAISVRNEERSTSNGGTLKSLADFPAGGTRTAVDPPSCAWDDPRATSVFGEIKAQLIGHTLATDYVLQVRPVGIRLKASMGGDITVKFRIQAALGANIAAAYSCKLPLPLSVRAALPGVFSPISLVVTPTARAKVGFAGSFAATSGFMEAVIRFPLSVGLDVNSEAGFTSAKPILDASNPIIVSTARDFFFSEAAGTSPRLISNLQLGIGADIGFAPTSLSAGSVEVAQAFVGAAIESKFGTQYVAALDNSLESGSSTKLLASMEQGADLSDFLKLFTKAGQAVDLTDFALNLELAEWESPKALTVRASKRTFRIGDNVEFRVQLDPGTLTTLFGTANNIEEIRVYKLLHATAGAVLLVGAKPSAGQTDVRLVWVADYDGSVTDVENTLFAFVVPTVPPMMGRRFPFPLGQVIATNTWDLSKDFSAINSEYSSWAYSRCRLVIHVSQTACDANIRDGMYDVLTNNSGLLTWNNGLRIFGAVAYNSNETDLNGAMTPWGFVNSVIFRSKQVYLHPGVGHTSYVNWLSPGGHFKVNVRVAPADANATGVVFRLLRTSGQGQSLGLSAAHSLVSSITIPRGGAYSSGDYIVDIPRGESLGFGVSDGGDFSFDTTNLIVTIEEIESLPVHNSSATSQPPSGQRKAIVSKAKAAKENQSASAPPI